MSYVRVRINLEGSTYYADFTSEMEFREDLQNIVRSGMHIAAIWSPDSDYLVNSSDTHEYFTGDDGSIFSYGMVYHMIMSEQWEELRSVFSVESARGGILPVNRINGDGNRRGSQLLTSGRLGILREIIKNPENRVLIENRLQFVDNHVKLGNNVLSSYDEIVQYYSTLGCVPFSLELYFVNNSLMLLFNNWFKYNDNERQFDKKGDFYLSVPRFVYNSVGSVGDGNTNKLTSNLFKKCKLGGDYSIPITDEQLLIIAKVMEINIFIYDKDVHAKLSGSVSKRFNGGIAELNKDDYEKFMELLLSGGLIPYNRINGADEKQNYFERRHSTIVFVRSSKFNDITHLEVKNDKRTALELTRGMQKGLWDTLNDEEGEPTKLVGRASYSSVGATNLVERFGDKFVISTDEDGKSTFSIGGNVKRVLIKNFENFKDMVDLLRECEYDTLPDLVSIEMDFFNDIDAISHVGTLNPYLKLVDVLGYVYGEFVKQDDSVVLSRVDSNYTSRDTRKSVVRSAARYENGDIKPTVHRAHNCGTFELVFKCGEKYKPIIFHTLKNVGMGVVFNIVKERREPNICKLFDHFDKQLHEHKGGKSKIIPRIPFEDYNLTLDHTFLISLSNINWIQEIMSQSKSSTEDQLKKYIKYGNKELKGILGSKAISSMQSVDTPAVETLKLFHSDICESTISHGYDGTSYSMSETPKLVELDLSKAYTNAACGEFTQIWERDLHDMNFAFGPMKNASRQEVKDPLTLYSRDSGEVLVVGADMNWSYLNSYLPEYFNCKSSWYHYLSSIRFVPVYKIIHVCKYVCKKKGITSRQEMLQVFKDIQMKGFKLTFGLFVFNSEERKFMGDRSPSLIKSKGDSTGICSKLSDFFELNPLLDYRAIPVENHRQGTTMYGTNGRTYAMNNNALDIFTVYKNAVEKVKHYAGDDQASAKGIINTSIGKMKYGSRGGVRVKTSIDELDDDVSFAVDDKAKLSNNVYYMLMDLPSTGCKTLLLQNTAKVFATRGSISRFRSYVMDTVSMLIDRAACESGAFRTVTDSILYPLENDEEFNDAFRRVIRRWDSLTTKDVIDIKKAYVESGADPQSCNLDTKYKFLLYNSRSKHRYDTPEQDGFNHNVVEGETAVPNELLDFDKELFSNIDQKWEEYRDSEQIVEAFREYGSECWRLVGCFINGQDIVNALYPLISTHPEVKTFFERFTKETAKLLLDLNGAVMPGPPGHGKTYRVAEMRRQEKCLLLASMHSIVQVSRRADVKQGECSTLHSAYRCGKNVAEFKMDPGSAIDNTSSIMRYNNIIIDEIETANIDFEEYFKYTKEMKKSIYFVGDAFQSAPIGSAGIDMFGSLAQYVCNNNIYHFDLQFRNINPGYVKNLKLAENGKITKYLDESMCNYYNGVKANIKLSEQTNETAEQIIQSMRDPNVSVTRTYATDNYWLQRMVTMDILRLVLMKDPMFVTEGTFVLWYSGPSAAYTTSYMSGLGKFRRDAKKGEGNNALIGMPLIMRRGIIFMCEKRHRVTWEGPNRSNKKKPRPYINKSTLYKYTGRSRLMTCITKKDLGITQSIFSTKYNLYFFEFEVVDSDKEIVWMSQLEVSMFLTYGFAAQKHFIIGCTLDQLSLVKPVHDRCNKDSYNSYKSILSRIECEYGEQSTITDEARFMRVAVTRVREVGQTDLINVPVSKTRDVERILCNKKDRTLMPYQEDGETELEYLWESMYLARYVVAGTVKVVPLKNSLGKRSRRDLVFDLRKTTSLFRTIESPEFWTLTDDVHEYLCEMATEASNRECYE